MKRGKSCTMKMIHFRTGRGKRVTFRGRPGGQKKHGGYCANVADKAGEKAQQRRFARAARMCKGRSRAKRNACVKSKLR
jgi:hypothetical protein